MLRKDEAAVRETVLADDIDATEPLPRRLGFWRPAISIAVAVGLGFLLYEEGLEDRVEMKNLGQVEPGLWRSGQLSRFMVGPSLRRIDPDLIVSLSHDNPDNADNMAERDAARIAGIERVHVNLRGDGTGDPAQYVEALTYALEARRAGQTVLVHCHAGAERTGGFVALWRTLVNGDPADEAIVDELRGHGHDTEDGVLVDYLNEHVAFIAQSLVDRGHLAAMPATLPHFTAD